MTIQPAQSGGTATAATLSNSPQATNHTLTLQALDSTGTAIPDADVTWTSSTQAVASVSQSGLVTGTAPGSTTITAQSGGATATYAITVVQSIWQPFSVPSGTNTLAVAPDESLYAGVGSLDAFSDNFANQAVDQSPSRKVRPVQETQTCQPTI